MGAAKGVVRRLPAERTLVYDYIPVDIVVNEMVVGVRQAAVDRYVSVMLARLHLK